MNRSAKLEPTEAGISPEEIRAQLERILESSNFKHSKRHTRFLQFIVEKSLSGEADEIKERVVGIEVFDRASDYDLANDAIVRVAAGELRRRLAQYYLNEAHADEPRLDLPLGSYVPVFSHLDQSELRVESHATAVVDRLVPHEFPSTIPQEVQDPPQVQKTSDQQEMELAAPKKALKIWPWYVVLGIAVLASLGGLLAYHYRPGRQLDAFWQPLLEGNPSVTICVGDLNSFLHDTSPIETETLTQWLRYRDHVGPYAVGAIARVASKLGQQGTHFSVVLADNISLTDLRNGPAVVIGALNNPWTQRILSGSRYRFSLDNSTGIGSIVDSRTSQKSQWNVDMNKPMSSILHDYAIVARIRSPLTGQTDLVIGGIGPYGTSTASEFISKPEYFQQFASRAPADWMNRNIEIVLSTDVVNGRSAPPHMILFDVQ